MTVVISLLGTWTVLNEVNSIRLTTPQVSKEAETSGKVILTIDPPKEPEVFSATGRVVLRKTE
ncbi:MAG: hypothetical protein KKF65_00390 [Nanoarchaeota archaeon]|nr:hypothetical protein [Nanoarchaeota archaeon]